MTMPRRFDVGRLHCTLLPDGEFRLDGGAMFGVVPRVMWEKKKPPDEHNRIRMTTNCLLIEAGDELVLVDTGLGDKGDARFNEQFALAEGSGRLLQQLARAGHTPEEITHVVLSHLHFDHCGWNTRELDGRLVPTFPRARYWIEAGELAHARHPNARDRASYDRRNWEPLVEAGVVETFSGEAEPVPGIRAVRAPGHNADMCVVLLDGAGPEGGGGEKAAFWADLVPTSAHVPVPWIMGYDLYPMQTLAAKEHWLPLAAAEGWLSIFEHDPELPLARLVSGEKGKLEVVPISE